MIEKYTQFFRVRTPDEMERAVIYAFSMGYRRSAMHSSSLEKATRDYRNFWETYKERCVLELNPDGTISYGSNSSGREIFLQQSFFKDEDFIF